MALDLAKLTSTSRREVAQQHGRFFRDAHWPRMTRLRVAVVGLGGVGGYCAVRMAQLEGLEVYGIAKARHVEAISKQQGFRVDSPAGDAFVAFPAVQSACQVGPVDIVIVACKAYDLKGAAREMLPLMGPETAVLPLLNGITAPEVLGQVLGAERCLGGLIRIDCFLQSPGHVVHGGTNPARIVAGALPPSAPFAARRLQELQAALNQAAGLRVEVPGDIRPAMWRKLVEISPLSAVFALSRADAAAVGAVPPLLGVLRICIREACAIARAHGADLDGEDMAAGFAKSMEEYAAKDPRGRPSMARDVEAGKVSEFDEQIGALVRKAEEGGVEAPTLRSLHALLLPQHQRALAARGEREEGRVLG